MPKPEDFVQNKFELDEGKIMSIVLSNPPKGKFLVKNLYIEPTTGKLIVEYDDVPQP